MIKTALKHWIYEVCIEQFFNGVNKNFFSNLNIEFKKGNKFKNITYLRTGCYYEIQDVTIEHYFFNINEIIARFKKQYYYYPATKEDIADFNPEYEKYCKLVNYNGGKYFKKPFGTNETTYISISKIVNCEI